MTQSSVFNMCGQIIFYFKGNIKGMMFKSPAAVPYFSDNSESVWVTSYCVYKPDPVTTQVTEAQLHDQRGAQHQEEKQHKNE